MMFAPTVLIAAAAYANLSWRSIGPAVAGGRVASVAGTPQNDQLYYLGTAGGGVWKSINAGSPTPSAVNWTPVTDYAPTLSVGSIAIQPGNSAVVLAATGEADNSGDSYFGLGILRSADAGATCTLIPNANSGALSVRDLASSSTRLP